MQALPLLSVPAPESDFIRPGRWWHAEDERIVCDLCPRHCSLKAGDRGFCFVRQNLDGQMMLTTYGRSTGFCIDPIEKKPLNHFYPGTSVLSFGTAGCNLGCKFCQNWDISKSREIERLSEEAGPEAIARAARDLGCRSVAFTYNDPVIWAEYAIDTARACHALGVKTVAVTAGYITKQARGEFYEVMDAANVDLKAFTEDFYQKLTLSHIEPVLETLRWLKRETNVWFEITNLVIPNANDSPAEFQQMCDWILQAVGDEVPVHFTAFHPDYRMTDRPNTPAGTLNLAREIALRVGLKYVYNGNVDDVQRQSTYCPQCGRVVIERNWYDVGRYDLKGGRCGNCGHTIAGHFDDTPGTWGRRRQRVDMREYADRHTPLEPAAQPIHPMGARSASEGGLAPSLALRASIADIAQPAIDPLTLPSPPGPTGVAMSSVTQTPAPTEVQQQALLTAAAEYVTATVLDRAPTIADPDLAGLGGQFVSGVYVSLKRKGKLRTCWGFFGRQAELASSLKYIAVEAVTSDPRFPPISPSELPNLDLEVWLLFAPSEVPLTLPSPPGGEGGRQGEARLGAISIGRHGLQIARGEQRGLFLPSVPVENNWNVEEYLDHLCLKANLPIGAWKDADTSLQRFEGFAYHRPLQIDKQIWEAGTLYSTEDLQTYARFYKDAIRALVCGASAMPYCTILPDYNVHAVNLRLRVPGVNREISGQRFSLLRSIPLQATLFNLCQDLAKQAARHNWAPLVVNGQFEVDIALAYDAATHGTVADPDLRGIDATRSLLVSNRDKTGWVFDEALVPLTLPSPPGGEGRVREMLARAAELASVRRPEAAHVYSFRMLSMQTTLNVRSAPQAHLGAEVRLAAVAGSFYPGDPAKMNAQLDELLAGDTPREHYAAVMVPHAGWRFSGKIAADVLKRVHFPKLVIALGPKHTPPGVEWAVAPQRIWQLPGPAVESDPVLARKLVRAIDGLELDATAHQQEHGIEVELPIIARLAPGTRVLGIAIGGGDLQGCTQFAAGLADLIKQMSEPPLLLISSDMNHFARDAETRRLDRLALDEIERLDANGLYHVAKRHHISMCGLLPAVIVIKTLQRLGRLKEARLIGYGTSADVTGDTTRVVGYAGMLLR